MHDLANGKLDTRSYALVAAASFSYDDFTSGVGLAFCTLPLNSVVIAGGVTISTAWDSGTSDTLEIGDGNDSDEYVGSVDAQSAASTILDADGLPGIPVDSDTQDILIEITSAGTAATAGVGSAFIVYAAPELAHENFE